MDAREAACLFKLWATDKGFVAKSHFATEPDAEIAAADFAPLEPASEVMLNVFHRRGILFVGFNETANQVIVYSDKKLTARELKRLPVEIENVEVVYKQGGIGAAGGAPGLPFAGGPYYVLNGRYCCGSSINPANAMGAGTLGCLVRDAQGALFGLTANHVTGGCNFSQPGLPILAPGPADVAAGNINPFTLGHHESCLTMVDGLPQIINASENSDAALLRIVNADYVSSMQRDVMDTPTAVQAMAAGQSVRKMGRSSGLTNGVIESQIAGAEPITYQVAATNSTKVVFFDSMFLIRGTGRMFAEPGDSGSLVIADIDGQSAAVGIVIAVNVAKEITMALPLTPILQKFGVNLVSGHNV